MVLTTDGARVCIALFFILLVCHQFMLSGLLGGGVPIVWLGDEVSASASVSFLSLPEINMAEREQIIFS